MKLFKKTIVFLMAISLLLGSIGITAFAQAFTDVSDSAYYADAVSWALSSGVTKGTSATTFSPDATCTRGQVVTFLWRSQGSPNPSSDTCGFYDVPEDAYYRNAVLWAVEQGITNGTSAYEFSPEQTCTRAHVITFIWRSMQQPSATGNSKTANVYTNTYYHDAVAWADTAGMLSNMGTSAFTAEENCPRSDIVTYLYRYARSTGDIGSVSTDTHETSAYSKLTPTSATAFNPGSVPDYSGSVFVQMNGNMPYFSTNNLSTDSYEMYGDLDSLGRCTTCVANVGIDLMPTEERGSIGSVKPTGWHTVKYDNVDGKYLYNRCHLIGYQLTAENANTKNLITGTRYFNVDGMLPFENLIAEYVEDTYNHILYRVTPVFEGNNLVASGVLLEGMSCEDKGESVCFCVFVYNIQPGIDIDYATGESWLCTDDESQSGSQQTEAESDSSSGQTSETESSGNTITYILNTSTHKFHLSTCSSAAKISAANRAEYTGTREELIAQGYEACKICKP